MQDSINSTFSVRPVIVMSRGDIKMITAVPIDSIYYEIDENMTLEEWANSEYNTLGITTLECGHLGIGSKHLTTPGEEVVTGVIDIGRSYRLTLMPC